MKLFFDRSSRSDRRNRNQTYDNEWNSVSDADDFDFDFPEEEYAEISEEEQNAEEEYSEEYSEEVLEEEDYWESEADGELADETYFVEAESEAEYVVDGFEDREDIEEEYLNEEYSDEADYEEDAYDAEYTEDEYEEQIFEDEEDENSGLIAAFTNMGVMDKLLIIGGLGILLLTLIFGSVFMSTKLLKNNEPGLSTVGTQLAQIETIGKSGLLAVSDAQRAALEAAEIAEEEEEEVPPTEYEEEEYKTEVTVKLSMSSIEKDLKIKFINKQTSKLVGNVPFSIQVSDPNGKTSLWSDDDMDGIIYKKNLKAGKYEVSVNSFEEEKYKKYELPVGKQKVEVKAEIAYEKVDVSNEVKSESQVDVNKEDTKKNETVVEGYLEDTVPWVESTVTLENYTEVEKSKIEDPMAGIVNSTVMSMSVDTSVSGNVPGETPTPDPEEGTKPEIPKPMVITLDKKAATVYVDHPIPINVTVENLMEDAEVTAVSSDTNIAMVQVNGQTIAVSGVAEGTAEITVKCAAQIKITEKNEDGTTVEKTETYEAVPVICTVEVKPNPQKDNKTVLKDDEGREVYVLDGEKYRQAYYADYYTFSKFYVKDKAKYTGWQTLEGKRYYFDASGKAVKGEQVIQGVKYNFASDGSLVTGSGTLGIDVSKWNGNIDWNAVKNSGVSYVIIRCGYRGSTEGALIKDSKFETNIKGAINAGLKVGVYFFTQAVDKNEAVEEASMVLDCIRNYKISYPVFLDVEASGGRADSIDKATRTEICKTFCETIQKYGYTAGVYANKNWFTEKINTGELSGTYKIWLAQYASAPTYTGRYDIWQYKSTGKISGISGDVDMNLSYLGY